MRVSDEDLEKFQRAADEAADEDDLSPESVAMASIIAELVALHKVADAAAIIAGAARVSRSMWDRLRTDLREAGR